LVAINQVLEGLGSHHSAILVALFINEEAEEDGVDSGLIDDEKEACN